MVVWRGWGILAILILLLVSVLVEFSVDAIFGSGFYKSAVWPLPLAFILAGVAVFFAGKQLNSKRGKILIDPETNQQVELKTTHTLFWIPMQYWGFVFAGLSVVIAVAK